MSAFRSGLHSLMPDNVTLLSGPGCPVCVTAQGDIDLMVGLATRPGVILCTYRSCTSRGSTLRSSIWVNRDGAWRLAFHQGTPFVEPQST